jgi:hypothetical protein
VHAENILSVISDDIESYVWWSKCCQVVVVVSSSLILLIRHLQVISILSMKEVFSDNDAIVANIYGITMEDSFSCYVDFRID